MRSMLIGWLIGSMAILPACGYRDSSPQTDSPVKGSPTHETVSGGENFSIHDFANSKRFKHLSGHILSKASKDSRKTFFKVHGDSVEFSQSATMVAGFIPGTLLNKEIKNGQRFLASFDPTSGEFWWVLFNSTTQKLINQTRFKLPSNAIPSTITSFKQLDSAVENYQKFIHLKILSFLGPSKEVQESEAFQSMGKVVIIVLLITTVAVIAAMAIVTETWAAWLLTILIVAVLGGFVYLVLRFVEWFAFELTDSGDRSPKSRREGLNALTDFSVCQIEKIKSIAKKFASDQRSSAQRLVAILIERDQKCESM